MDYQLKDKLALVTGSTAGIGLAIATVLAGEGARVILNGRTEERVTQARKQIAAQHPQAQLEVFTGDLSQTEQIERLVAQFPAVEILINNLGIYGPKPFLEINDDEWHQIIETNFFSGLRLSRMYLPSMLEKNWGRIIFISSESGIQIPQEMIHYGVTKTMQIALGSGLAELTKGTAVTVNSVLPGPTRSEGVEEFVKNMAKHRNKPVEEVEKDFFKDVRPGSLLQRFATNEEVAQLVAYVASPLSAATNGSALRVDGGAIRSAF